MAFVVTRHTSEDALEVALNALTTETIIWVLAKGAEFVLIVDTV